MRPVRFLGLITKPIFDEEFGYCRCNLKFQQNKASLIAVKCNLRDFVPHDAIDAYIALILIYLYQCLKSAAAQMS